MTNSVEDRTYALLAKERGVDRSRLRPGTTLSHDLGLEGDDAKEFFESFEEEFSTDLKLLREDWNHYFAAEGVSLLAVIPGVIASVLFLGFFRQLPSWLSVLLGFLLGFVLLFVYIRLFGKKSPQLSVQDLIDCAHARKWTKTLPQEVKRKMSARTHKVGLFP